MLSVLGYTGVVYCITAALLGTGWCVLGLQGFVAADERTWARRMFFYSLVNMASVNFVSILEALT